MYITILDYSRQSVSIIHDENDLTVGMSPDEERGLLERIGFSPEDELVWMITEEDPYQNPEGCATLEELLEDTD